MEKVKQSIKEVWESDKKPDCMVLSKTGKDTGIVRVKRLKIKRKVRSLPRSEPSSRGSTTGVGIKRIRD